MTSHTLRFTESPPSLSNLARAALHRPARDLPWPQLRAEVAELRIRPEWLERYREVCGFAPGRRVPSTVPQVLAVPTHIAMLAHPSFPLPAMGIVHVSQRMQQHMPIPVGEPLTLETTLGPAAQARRGTQFSIVTTLRSEHTPLWTGETTILSRVRHASANEAADAHAASVDVEEDAGLPSHCAEWSLASDLGRRYTRVAGDVNPIHLSALTARPFGFRRAIIHGMWTLGRALAELESDNREGPSDVRIAFRRPIPLPSTIRFRAWKEDAGHAFVVQDRNDGSAHARGRVVFG